MSENDRFKAATKPSAAQGWQHGDFEGARQAVADAFQLDLSTEDGRRKADEYIATLDPDAAFGPNHAKRIKDDMVKRRYAEMALKEIEENDRRLELKLKEDAAKLRENAKARIESYENERLTLTRKRDLPDML